MFKILRTDYKPWWAQRMFHRSKAPIRTIVAGRQSGKLLQKSEPVLTPTGWSPIGDLKVGDLVVSGEGKPTEVLGVFRNDHAEMFRLTFDDGASVVCCGEHLWYCQTRPDRVRKRRGPEHADDWSVITLNEIISRWGLVPHEDHRVQIPLCASEQSGEPAPIDPYLLGALLGDGCLTTVVSFTSADSEIVDRCREGLPPGVKVVKYGGYAYGFSRATPSGANPLKRILVELGVHGHKSYTKFIPKECFHTPLAWRWELLRGLMDTDGTCGKRGGATYTSVSLQLAEDVQTLVRSLGGKANIKRRQTHYTYKGVKKPGAPSYRVRIRVTENPFFLKRKADRWFRPTSTPDRRVLYKIEPVGFKEGVCIRVASPCRTFVTKDYIVTHNTHAAAEEVVRIVCQRPETESCLLMPTYKSSKGALRHLNRALAPLGTRIQWKEVDKCFVFWNGSKLYIRTIDKTKNGVPTRGLTLDGVLWLDEAAYLPKNAFDAARLTQAAVENPLVIITTTPCGGNWVKVEWDVGDPTTRSEDCINESFRFKSLDSPFCNPKFIEDMREKLGAKKALQELNAQFLGDSGAAFNVEDIQSMLVSGLRLRGDEFTLGIDLAKEVDFTVITLMNELGEAWILARFKNVDWPDVEKRITGFAKQHNALVVLDIGHGGGYGGALYDYLERALGKEQLLGIKTGNLGVKAMIVETLIKDIESHRLAVAEGKHSDNLRHEMTFFESHREVVGGVERIRYNGPQGDGADDHDDCVISLALANWGRIHGWDKKPVRRADLSQYAVASKPSSTHTNSGYRFNFPRR